MRQHAPLAEETESGNGTDRMSAAGARGGESAERHCRRRICDHREVRLCDPAAKLRRAKRIGGEQRGITAAEKDRALGRVGRSGIEELHGNAARTEEAGQHGGLLLITRSERGEDER